MNADLLRRAASLMRERAEAATPGAWSRGDNEVTADADLVYDDPRWPGKPILPHDGPMEIAECYRNESPGERQANAEHIASWHPAVALAVAESLADVAYLLDHGSTSPAQVTRALAVARAYLGEDA